MIIKSTDLQYFTAGDLTHLAEVLHPKNIKIPLPLSLAHAYIEPGEKSLLHTLDESEIYYIIAGNGLFLLDDQAHEIGKGDCVFVHANTVQAIQNTGDVKLEFICIVFPPWTATGEFILEK